MRYKIGVTRFNNETWDENKRYRENNNLSNAIIYGTPVKINHTVNNTTMIYVLEMNNSINKIMGIGLVKNISYPRLKIYSVGDYNRYIYKSNYRIDKDNFNKIEIKLIEQIESLVFTSKGHMKRGVGITILPNKLYSHTKLNDNGKNVIDYLKWMFIKRNYPIL